MLSKTPSRTFNGSVYTLIASRDDGQETLQIRIIDGHGRSLDLALDVMNGRVLESSLAIHNPEPTLSRGGIIAASSETRPERSDLAVL